MPRDPWVIERAAADAQLDMLDDHAVPDGWATSEWWVTETTRRRVVVRHPAGATVADQAGAALAAHGAAGHPDQVFEGVPAPDRVAPVIGDDRVGPDVDPSDGWIAWHDTTAEQHAAA